MYDQGNIYRDVFLTMNRVPLVSDSFPKGNASELAIERVVYAWTYIRSMGVRVLSVSAEWLIAAWHSSLGDMVITRSS